MSDPPGDGGADRLEARIWGSTGPALVLVHGGPGAPGYLAPVACELSDAFRVLEPFQRGSGGEALTVERHVADLAAAVEERFGKERPALVGHSWGAMLALACAAARPGAVACVAAIGCGTFDRTARARLEERIEERMSPEIKARLRLLEAGIADPDERLRATGDLLLPVYSHDPVVGRLEAERCDARAFRETWEDMVRQQSEGRYPAALASWKGPVLMMHGDVDPHPGEMVRASLAPHLPQIEYVELERCGHYPWLERSAGKLFFRHLRDWLMRMLP